MSEIEEIQSAFRILKNWDICVELRQGYCGHCYIDVKKKFAQIDEWQNDEPEDYILHEMLHIAIGAIKTRDDEELVVQDICQLLK